MPLDKELASAIVTGLFSLAAIVLTVLLPVLLSRKKAKRVESQRAEVLSIAEKFARNAKVLHELKHLLESTNIDRIIIFFARNGTKKAKYVSATFQLREGDSYFAFDDVYIDDGYRSMLAASACGLPFMYKQGDNPNTILDDIYLMEELSEAMIESIAREAVGFDGSIKQSIVSYATHDKEGLTAQARTAATLVTGQLRALVHL